MRLPTPALVAGLIALSASASALSRPETLDDSERAAPKASCWRTHSQAVYRGFGYDHIVEIDNACDKAVACVIRTDVNPEATSAQVAAHETASVITFHGSPASTFKADVQCKPVS